MNYPRKELRRHSLFAKLLLIFTGLMFAIIFTYICSFKTLGKRAFGKAIHKNITIYTRYIIEDIGTPVTLDGLKRVRDNTGIEIIYNGLKTNPALPSINQIEVLHEKGNHLFFGGFDEQRFVVYKDGDNRYAFTLHLNFEHKFPVLPLTVATLLSIFYIIIAYKFVNKLFSPLVTIKEGASHFAKGDFTYPISVKGHGQLAELSHSIQEMGEKIQGMLESKRELLLAIAHELRTPITRAKLHLELLDDSSKKEDLSYELEEMSSLINDLLESERLKEGHSSLILEEKDMATLVKTCVSYFNGAPIDIETKSCLIKVDWIRFSLAIKNILSNAVRHSRGHPINLVQTEQYISISNTGDKIEPSEIYKITDAFYRPDKSRVRMNDGGGVGLGLYLVSQIVKAHDFKLQIESTDELTTFKILF